MALERVLAVDYGEKRIGLAVSDPLGVMCHGLPVLDVKSRVQVLQALTQLVEERRVARVVVGLPLNMDGSVGPRARAVEEFAAALRACLAAPVDLWDERLSSVEAEDRLKGLPLSKHRRRAHVNTVAAQVILESYLRARPAGPQSPES